MTEQGRPGRRWAWAVLVVGGAHALVSVSWGLGSTAGLATVGGTLEELGRAGDPLLVAVLWLSVALKLVAAGLGLAVTGRRPAPAPLVLLAWAAAAVLTVYGGLLTVGGLLVQAGVVPTADDADRYALAWHAYVWDPWFLLWGVLLVASLRGRGLPVRRTSRPTTSS